MQKKNSLEGSIIYKEWFYKFTFVLVYIPLFLSQSNSLALHESTW